jgi:hypothetical protein
VCGLAVFSGDAFSVRASMFLEALKDFAAPSLESWVSGPREVSGKGGVWGSPASGVWRTNSSRLFQRHRYPHGRVSRYLPPPPPLSSLPSLQMPLGPTPLFSAS